MDVDTGEFVSNEIFFQRHRALEAGVSWNVRVELSGGVCWLMRGEDLMFLVLFSQLGESDGAESRIHV
jgi:hypothetical protein